MQTVRRGTSEVLLLEWTSDQIVASKPTTTHQFDTGPATDGGRAAFCAFDVQQRR